MTLISRRHGRKPTRERGRPARNLIRASSLRFRGHSLEQSTKPAFAGFATLVPSPMRARRPRSRVGPSRPSPGAARPYSPRPDRSETALQFSLLPARPLKNLTGALRRLRTGWRETGSKSGMGKRLIHIDAQDAHDIFQETACLKQPKRDKRALCKTPHRDLDIPTSWEEAHPGARASRPQPYSCKQPAIQRHSLEQCTKPAFAGFATLVPSPMRARRPRSRVGPSRPSPGAARPYSPRPDRSETALQFSLLPARPLKNLTGALRRLRTGWRETGSKSGMGKRLIHIDAQDAHDIFQETAGY